MGAARAWQTSSGWTGRRFHLGTNKDTEVYAIYQAFRVTDQRQENGHRYIILINATATIDRLRTDATSPGQRFATATMEAYSRVLGRGNSVTIRWVPSHQGVADNEKADEYVSAAAERSAPQGERPGPPKKAFPPHEEVPGRPLLSTPFGQRQ